MIKVTILQLEVLTINNTIHALIRILNDLLNHLIIPKKIDPNKMIQQIESTLKLDFSSKLKEYHGENWLVKGIPAKIYKQANAELGVRNYENAKKGVKQKSAEVKKLKLHGLIEFQILQKILQTAIALQKMSFNM